MENTEEIGEIVAEHLYRPLAEQAEQAQSDRLADLASTELSPTQVLDYYMIAEGEYSATEWANVRDVSPQAVWEAVERAKDVLSDDDDVTLTKPPRHRAICRIPIVFNLS